MLYTARPTPLPGLFNSDISEILANVQSLLSFGDRATQITVRFITKEEDHMYSHWWLGNLDIIYPQDQVHYLVTFMEETKEIVVQNRP